MSLRIANCSGFYGDRLSAAREMVEGGPIDVLTGDYLAELTMAILHGKRAADENAGYVGTFIKQMRGVLEPCLGAGIKIVSNAGGLNPEGCAEAVRAVAEELSLKPCIAWIDGDDLAPRLDGLVAAGERFINLDTGASLTGKRNRVVTANVYLGSWGIKEALDRGADIVIAPRVTDAALVIGPAAWRFNWRRDDYDALAGALLAGHLIECGPGVTGGNYPFMDEVKDFHNVGFPIAEIETDGSFTITKHEGTGGLVSVGTVTAQTLYEIAAPAYVNPDVTGHFDSFTATQTGPDRVRVRGCKGSSPPPTHKACINLTAGHRISVEMLLTGLDIEKKAKIFTDVLFKNLGGREQFDAVTELLLPTNKADPISNDEAAATLRLIVQSDDPKRVGRLFAAKVTELAISNYAGFFGRPAATSSGPVAEHWPALIDSKHIVERVHIDGDVVEVLPSSRLGLPKKKFETAAKVPAPPAPQETVSIPLGRLFGARSGDKGGAANVGVWAQTDDAYAFLYHYLTVEQLKTLLPDMAQYPIERYELANIRALNFVIRGVLGKGVAAATRTDGQAKSLCEYLRAKVIEAPKALCLDLV